MPASEPADPDASFPATPFFSTPQQRVALARERFFDEGVRPSGLVSETVIQSWTRCLGARRSPDERIAFDPVSKARIGSVLERNRQLLDAAQSDLCELEIALAGTSCKAFLTSPDGVIVHATPTAREEGGLMPIVARVGVVVGEDNIGTAAPGVVARTGEACVVNGAEHFFTGIGRMYCAAAPIRDARGEVAAVLDLSSEVGMFGFDAAAMVKVYATNIENRLLEAQSAERLLLRFQASPSLLFTPLEGLAAVDGQGRVRSVNASAASLLGQRRVLGDDVSVEALFGIDLEGLLDLSMSVRAWPQRVPSGLLLWIQVHSQGPAVRAPRIKDTSFAGWLPTPEGLPNEPAADATALDGLPSQAPAEAETLHDSNRALIESTLAACRGNVSRAARRLGVSRGLLYRRLAQWRDAGTADD